MTNDIGKALAYQVKREIAERYFGLRKFIEEERRSLEETFSTLNEFYELKIGPDLIRIYSILVVPRLIDRFMGLVGWEGRPFYDDYVVESRTIRVRLFQGMELHGWTSQTRFRNRLLDSYEKLFEDGTYYMRRVQEAVEEGDVINEEIRQFKNKFSLEEILSFIASLDRNDALTGVLGDNLPKGAAAELDARLDIAPVDDVLARLPRIPELPEPEAARARLKELAAEAFAAKLRRE
jgi:hypothetical protein